MRRLAAQKEKAKSSQRLAAITPPNKSLDASGGGEFRKIIGLAMLE